MTSARIKDNPFIKTVPRDIFQQESLKKMVRRVKIVLWIFYLGEGVCLGNEWDDIDPVVNALQELDIQWPDHLVSWSELRSQPRPLNVTLIAVG
jgi:hypothetical protein